MAIMALMAGGTSVIFTDTNNGDKEIREEADNLALWFMDRMSRAQVEECCFKLSMSQKDTKNASFRLVWQGGTQHGKTEVYESSRVRIFPQTGDLSRSRIFDGEWSSLTPALTVDVKPQPPHDGKPLYVVVSGAGYVTIKDKLN